jgi:hypothetical protein
MLRKRGIPTHVLTRGSIAVSEALAVLYAVVIPLVCGDVAQSITRPANFGMDFSRRAKPTEAYPLSWLEEIFTFRIG